MLPVRPDVVQDGYHQLQALVDQQAAVQLAVEEEVRNLIDRGHSWTEIGRVLGMSRQGARQRFRRR